MFGRKKRRKIAEEVADRIIYGPPVKYARETVQMAVGTDSYKVWETDGKLYKELEAIWQQEVAKAVLDRMDRLMREKK